MKLLLSALLAAAMTLSAADVTGTWTGSFTVNGEQDTRQRPAHLVLKQEGSTLTGTGGPTESEQHPISNGKVEGDIVTFDVSEGDHFTQFSLKQTGDTMTGKMSRDAHGGKQTADLTLERSK